MGLLPRDEPTALRLERLRSQLRSSQVQYATEFSTLQVVARQHAPCPARSTYVFILRHLPTFSNLAGVARRCESGRGGARRRRTGRAGCAERIGRVPEDEGSS